MVEGKGWMDKCEGERGKERQRERDDGGMGKDARKREWKKERKKEGKKERGIEANGKVDKLKNVNKQMHERKQESRTTTTTKKN